MKLKLGNAATCLALLLGMVGCAYQDDDIVPAKRPGFRPPSSPLVQDDLPPVDPLAGTGDSEPTEAAPPKSNGGFQGATGGVASNPPAYNSVPPSDPNSQPPAQAPAPPPEKPPKTAGPEYAKRVPGKPNWIRSPYDGKILDATGFPPGTEVRDPQSGKIMLVP
jgi:hypothetical protein